MKTVKTGTVRSRIKRGDQVVVIPYVMPGFDLARLCAQRFPAERTSRAIGMVLMNHGVFSFGDTAREFGVDWPHFIAQTISFAIIGS